MPEPFAAPRAYDARHALPARPAPNPVLSFAKLVLAWTLRGAERSRSRRDLAAMDARLLRDIGLTPFERQREVDKWWWRA